jgi:hypothetical protein
MDLPGRTLSGVIRFPPVSTRILRKPPKRIAIGSNIIITAGAFDSAGIPKRKIDLRVLGIPYRIKLVDRRATHVTTIVVAHLLVNIAHGLAHRELRVGLALAGTMFVVLVVLIAPLLAMGLLWTAKKRLALMLLSLSMFGSFLFGLYHHFLAMGPDHVDSQPWSPWGLAFGLTAYALLITEAIGTYVGIHFLRIPKSG